MAFYALIDIKWDKKVNGYTYVWLNFCFELRNNFDILF